MSRLFIPAIHLPNGRDLFRPLPYRPAEFKRVLKSYSERCLLECLPVDTIVLAQMPDDDYLDFLLNQEIGTEKIIECKGPSGNLSQDILENRETMLKLGRAVADAEEVLFYIHLEEEREIASRLAPSVKTMHPDLTRMFNKYSFLLHLCEDLGLPLIDSRQVRSNRFVEPVRRLLRHWGKLFVRGNESVGGSQAFVIESEDAIEEVNRKISRNSRITRYFVFPFLNASQSWNVQYFFGNEGCSLFGTSMQILENGITHKGNVGGEGNPPEEVLTSSGLLAGRLGEMGAKGFIGIDLMEADGGIYPVEINARQNSSTPILAVHKRILRENRVKEVFFKTFSIEVPRGFRFGDFAGKVGHENLFDFSSGRGLLPFHFGACGITGKLDVAAFALKPDEIDQLVRVVVEIV